LIATAKKQTGKLMELDDFGIAPFAIAAVIGIITVFIVALMIRRDREEAEARGAVVPTRGRHRWNDTEGGR